MLESILNHVIVFPFQSRCRREVQSSYCTISLSLLLRAFLFSLCISFCYSLIQKFPQMGIDDVKFGMFVRIRPLLATSVLEVILSRRCPYLSWLIDPTTECRTRSSSTSKMKINVNAARISPFIVFSVHITPRTTTYWHALQQCAHIALSVQKMSRWRNAYFYQS